MSPAGQGAARPGGGELTQAALADLFRHADGTLDDDPWPLVREVAGSGDHSAEAPVRAALRRYARERNWYGRDLMAHVLAGLAGAGGFPLLLRAYADALRGDRDDDGERLGRALGIAMSVDRAGCRAVILPLLAGEDPALRTAALWALRGVFEPPDLETLRAALADPDPAVRRAALHALPRVDHDPLAYELVVAALRDPDAEARRHAVLLLAWSAPPAVVDHLMPLAADPDAYVRSAVGEALGRRAAGSDRVPAAAAALRELLADDAPSVRAAAIRGFGALGGPLDALASRVEDPDWWIRRTLAEVLAVALRRWPPARPLLVRLADDSNPTVRYTATKALSTPA